MFLSLNWLDCLLTGRLVNHLKLLTKCCNTQGLPLQDQLVPDQLHPSHVVEDQKLARSALKESPGSTRAQSRHFLLTDLLRRST